MLRGFGKPYYAAPEVVAVSSRASSARMMTLKGMWSSCLYRAELVR